MRNATTNGEQNADTGTTYTKQKGRGKGAHTGVCSKIFSVELCVVNEFGLEGPAVSSSKYTHCDLKILYTYEVWWLIGLEAPPCVCVKTGSTRTLFGATHKLDLVGTIPSQVVFVPSELAFGIVFPHILKFITLIIHTTITIHISHSNTHTNQ